MMITVKTAAVPRTPVLPSASRQARGRWRRMMGSVFLTLLPGAALAAEAGADAAPSLTERMMVLVIQLGVILFAARLGGHLFERLHLEQQGIAGLNLKLSEVLMKNLSIHHILLS